MFLSQLAALIMLSSQKVRHFLLQHLLNQPFCTQAAEPRRDVFFAFQSIAIDGIICIA